jgi:chromate transporter
VQRNRRVRKGQDLRQVAALFLRLGATAFGGPAAHIALIERECVQRRRWITREQFLDVLGVANLVPGPTSTELAMHVGRLRAGWPGLVAAGLAFILPAALLIGLLAMLYVRAGDLPVARGVSAAIQPVVIVMVLQALLSIGPTAVRSVPLVVIALGATGAALAGVPEILVLLASGAVPLVASLGKRRGRGHKALILSLTMATGGALLLAAEGDRVPSIDVFGYFLRVGSLLFGSGYVLLPVLQGDLVERLGWLTDRQLLDAIAAGQATPGPLFTTATFIGYLLGGPAVAVIATVAMFLPAFVFTALSSLVLERLSASRYARAFLDGVNAAAVALILVVVITLARTAFSGPLPVAVGLLAAVAILIARFNPSWVLLAAALTGAAFGLITR